MSNKIIESFLNYEEIRKDQKTSNEFQAAKQLAENNSVRTVPVGRVSSARPLIRGPSANIRTGSETNALDAISSDRELFNRFSNPNDSAKDVTNDGPPTDKSGAPDAPVPAAGEGSMDAARDSNLNAGGSRSVSVTAPTVRTSTGRQNASSSYTIKSGDTLGRIAQRNNLSVSDLMSANPDIKDPNRIDIGQNLRIPNSVSVRGKNIYAGGVGAGGPRPNNESVEFSEEELAYFNSVMEAMPVAPTPADHAPNPTPTKKAEGGKGRGSLSEKMDPVGSEDEDVDNDGKVDKSDEYLKNRRRAIAMKMKEK